MQRNRSEQGSRLLRFTRYVMKYGASVEIPHSSTGQAACGTEVSEEEMQPGDLIFTVVPLAGSIMWLCMREMGRLFMLLQKKQALSCLLIITGEPVKIVSVLE